MVNILVADDDLFYRNLVADFLHNEGYSVTTVSSGKEAFRLWKQNHSYWDCMIFDVYMEELSGIEVAEKIRYWSELESDEINEIPIIIMTSDNKNQTEIDARQAQIFAFLIKPFSKDELVNIVNKAVANKNANNLNN